MAFYVPLGSRGILFRVGTVLIGVLGSMVYRRAHRQRRRAASYPATGMKPSRSTAI